MVWANSFTIFYSEYSVATNLNIWNERFVKRARSLVESAAWLANSSVLEVNRANGQIPLIAIICHENSEFWHQHSCFWVQCISNLMTDGMRRSRLMKCYFMRQVILDMTFGAGGHTRALLSRCSNVTVYALDRDETAYTLAQQLALDWYVFVRCFVWIYVCGGTEPGLCKAQVNYNPLVVCLDLDWENNLMSMLRRYIKTALNNSDVTAEVGLVNCGV